jgi:hypothetical protein
MQKIFHNIMMLHVITTSGGQGAGHVVVLNCVLHILSNNRILPLLWWFFLV